MNPELKLARLLACAAMVAAVAACGGGGSSDPAPNPPPPPAPEGGVPPPPPPTPVPTTPPVGPPVGPPVSQAGTPIMFVTQVPIGGDTFKKITSTFGHHLPGVTSVPRGGDLWIAYREAAGVELRNLTAAAGFGVGPDGQPLAAQTGPNAIAVRDPSVHASGTRALVSMVVGDGASARWQIYEVTGFRRGETVRFTRLAQPATYNNISPVYGSDGQVIFTSDIPRAGPAAQFAHLLQLDEYEEEPTVSGLWKLDPVSGAVRLLHHAPSGAFRPIVDSYGRVIFTNWDHLQRDQQVGSPDYITFNFSNETAAATIEPTGDNAQIQETFPEPQNGSRVAPGHARHTFNFFIPWMLNQDGTTAETLNHIGRHELGIYGEPTILNAGLSNMIPFGVNRTLIDTGIKFETAHFIKENPLVRGEYYAISAPEFGTHGGGMIYRIQGGPQVKPHEMRINLVTPVNTAGAGGPVVYRSPLPLRDGSLVAAASFVTHRASNQPNETAPYAYRLHKLTGTGAAMAANTGTFLTPGITKRLQSGAQPVALWEWDPVEVPATATAAAPLTAEPALEAPESQAFAEAEVDPAELRNFMRTNGLALIVSRDVTSRDSFDLQQPFNLRVTGTAKATVKTGSTAPVFDIDHLQLFQADQLRGMGSPDRGRRVLPMPMTGARVGAAAANPAAPEGPAGAVKIAADGSMAAFVPADRAMTWQLVKGQEGDPIRGTTGVVRERFWLSFRPGEVRVCASCHGHSEKSQIGGAEPTNKPQALVELLRHYRNTLR